MTETTATDPPPQYQASAEESKRTAKKRTPSNYIRIVRDKGEVQDNFVLDTSINIKENLLPELDESEKAVGRRNLCVKTKDNRGEIDIGVDIKGTAGTRKKITIEAEALKADALLRLDAPAIETRPLLRVHVTSGNGIIVVFLPSSTAGLINVTSTGPVILSEKLAEATNIVNEDGQSRKYIIGTVDEWDEEDKDQFFINAKHGRVYLRYNDEPHVKPVVGFWARCFGN
ncbi:hypothetical protein VNI00_012749 [Paramarasmius palmivorus]|uniref:DUF7330 domain-containing protein n=1 Tax=Paramarasmius palmivorus TaxID=297713 RepID=A0AAW0C2V1_9AGAR